MTNIYIAPTNGHEIIRTTDGGLRINMPGMDYVAGHEPQTLVAGRVESLREYFRDERDRELGRWRSNAEPGWVVYRTPNVNGDHYVLDELTGYTDLWGRDTARDSIHSEESKAIAVEYFASHPGPKPWEDSPAGSVWKIVSGGRGAHALIWRSHDGDWDVLTPRGESLDRERDPLAALIEAGYGEFEDYQSAKELKES